MDPCAIFINLRFNLLLSFTFLTLFVKEDGISGGLRQLSGSLVLCYLLLATTEFWFMFTSTRGNKFKLMGEELRFISIALGALLFLSCKVSTLILVPCLEAGILFFGIPLENMKPRSEESPISIGDSKFKMGSPKPQQQCSTKSGSAVASKFCVILRILQARGVSYTKENKAGILCYARLAGEGSLPGLPWARTGLAGGILLGENPSWEDPSCNTIVMPCRVITETLNAEVCLAFTDAEGQITTFLGKWLGKVTSIAGHIEPTTQECTGMWEAWLPMSNGATSLLVACSIVPTTLGQLRQLHSSPQQDASATYETVTGIVSGSVAEAHVICDEFDTICLEISVWGSVQTVSLEHAQHGQGRSPYFCEPSTIHNLRRFCCVSRLDEASFCAVASSESEEMIVVKAMRVISTSREKECIGVGAFSMPPDSEMLDGTIMIGLTSSRGEATGSVTLTISCKCALRLQQRLSGSPGSNFESPKFPDSECDSASVLSSVSEDLYSSERRSRDHGLPAGPRTAESHRSVAHCDKQVAQRAKPSIEKPVTVSVVRYYSDRQDSHVVYVCSCQIQVRSLHVFFSFSRPYASSLGPKS
jgi:hypothetical protein